MNCSCSLSSRIFFTEDQLPSFFLRVNAGTLEEILEILSFKQLGFHQKPVAFVNTKDYFDHLLAQFERGFQEAFIHERFRDLYTVTATPEEAVAFIEATSSR